MKEFVDKLIGMLEELRIDKSNYFGVLNIVAEKYDRANEMLDDAIEITKELAEEYIPCTKPCTDCEAYDLVKHNCPKFCKVIKETVEELAEEYNNGWIPCSERLPELTEGTECFKQSKCCLTTLKWWDGDMTESVGWYNQSGVWNEDSKNCKVIAWMPLPQPYTVPPTEQPTWKQQTMNRFERVD